MCTSADNALMDKMVGGLKLLVEHGTALDLWDDVMYGLRDPPKDLEEKLRSIMRLLEKAGR